MITAEFTRVAHHRFIISCALLGCDFCTHEMVKVVAMDKFKEQPKPKRATCKLELDPDLVTVSHTSISMISTSRDRIPYRNRRYHRRLSSLNQKRNDGQKPIRPRQLAQPRLWDMRA